MNLSKNVTLVDVVVIVLIVLILYSIFHSRCQPTRELAKRFVCAANLGGIGKSIAMYASQARGSFPLVTTSRMRDSGTPENGLRQRPDEGTILMFDRGQAVAAGVPGGLHRWQAVVDPPEGVSIRYPHVRLADKNERYAFPSRELYLLIKGNYAQQAQFVCPSTAHEADPMWADRPESASHLTDVRNALHLQDATEVVPASRLWDFLQPDTLDYGYMFAHDANGEQANESMDPQHPVMADANPYIRSAMAGGKVPVASNKQNSLNHDLEGQNVLFGDLHAQFFDMPTVGVGGDNIYTAWYSRTSPSSGYLGEVPTEVPGEAPRIVPGPAGDPPSNYLFDIVSRTDAMLLP